jgi:hypothetical protein
MADTICTERDSSGGMERESRHIVRDTVLLSPRSTDSPAALYNPPPGSRYLFMRKRPWGRTSLLDSRILPVNPETVRLFLGILSDIFG